jgi:hypothetical protein
MIRPEDRFALPRGVRLTAESLEDTAVRDEYPLIGSAPMCIELLARGHSIREVARMVASRFAISETVVASDLAGLVLTLNRAGLLNARSAGGPLARARRKAADLALGLAVGVRPPVLVTRHELAAPSLIGTILEVTTAVLIGHAWLWLGLGAVFAGIGLISSPSALLGVAALQLGLISGLIVHEVGHAIAARRWSGGCFLLTSGIGAVRVMHRRAGRRVWISAAGPGLAGACGAALLAAGCAMGSGALALAALPLLGNFLGFTILFGDGRSIVSGPWRAA